jgi:hypothetical protein
MDHYSLQIQNYFFYVAQQPYLEIGRLTDEVPRSYTHHNHTHRHTTICSTSLGEGSVRRRDLYLTNTQNSPETNIHARGGSRTLIPGQLAAEDLRLRPRGHWNRADSPSTYYSQSSSTLTRRHMTSAPAPRKSPYGGPSVYSTDRQMR